MATRRQIVTLVLSGDSTGLYKSLSAAEKETVTRSRAIVSGVAAIGTIAVAAGAKFTAMATEINAGMSEVSTLIPGQTERIVALRSAVQDLSVQYGTKTEGLVGGLYQGISAWGDTADTVKILEINVRAAKAGVAETSQAINLTSAVTKGYGDTNAAAVKHVADLAFKTVELGQTTFPELAASIGDVVPLAVELGVTQEEMFAVMATGTGVTGNTAKVATQYKGILAAMLKPTGDLSDLYEQLGVETGKQLIEQRGMQGALDAIAEAARRTGIPLTKYLGRVEATTLGLALTGAQSDTLTTKTRAMETQIDASGVAFTAMTEGVNASSFALDQHKQQAIVWGQKIGQAIINFSGPLATGLLGFAQLGGSLSLMAPQITALMVTMGGWSGVMGIVSGAAKVMWLSVTGPVGIVIGVLAAVGVGLYAFRDKLGLTKGTADATGRSLTDAKARVVDLQDQIDGASRRELPALRRALEAARQELDDWKSPLTIAQEKVAAFEARLEGASTRALPSLRRALADARAEVTSLQVASADVIPQLTLASLGFDLVTTAAEKTAPPIVAVEEAAADLTDTIEWQSAKLDHWASQLNGIGKAVTPIPPFLSTLTGTIEDQSAALGHWGLDASNIGIQLEPVPLKIDKVEESAGKLNVTLAAMSGQIGGVAGQSVNLVASMIQTNDQLKVGEEGFSRVAIGAATVASGLHMVGDAMGGTTGAIVSGVGTIASAFATGGPFSAAIAGAGLLIKGLMSLGGPSEAQLLARKTFGAWHAGAVDALGETQRFADEVQVGIAAGWDRTLAETRAGFIVWGTDAGLTYNEAFAKYEQYQHAVATGNTALMAQLDAEFAGYRKTSEETNAAAAQSAEDAAAKAAAAWEKATSAVMSAYERAKNAGVAAYDKIFKAAIKSGASQETAAKKATAAQEKESAKILAIEKKKFIRIARFDAALLAIRSGNAAGATEAARQAAADTSSAWDVAMGQVEDADQAATDAMKGHSTETATQAKQDARDKQILAKKTSEKLVEQMAAAQLGINAEFLQMTTDAVTETGNMAGAFGGMATDVVNNSISRIQGAISGIVGTSVDVRVNHHTTYSSSGSSGEGGEGAEGRQHGGPVFPGRPYIVGERRRELFIPSERGTILPFVPRSGGGGTGRPIDITLQIDGRTLNAELIRVHENTLDFYGQ